MPITKRSFAALFWTAAFLHGSDAGLLQPGRFVYGTLVNGKDGGSSEISIRQVAENFVFTNQVSGEFKQRWEAVATRMFVPISAKLAFGEGEGLSPAFELHYHDGRVTGFRLERPHAADSARLNVDAAVQAGTVDQRIDWAAAISERLVVRREFAFHVYDPGTGLSQVTGRVVGLETVRVPAGVFDGARILYRIEKAKATEEYQVLTNLSGRRILLKEEFPNGAVTELKKY